MQLISQVMLLLESLAHQIPVEIFTFFGTILEEVLAPIPSPFVMGMAGGIAQAQSKALPFLIFLAILGALGRVIGASFLYFSAEIAEKIVVDQFGKFIGIKSSDIDKISSRFNGTTKDYLTLIILRSIPVMPSSPLSVVCGLIKLKYRVFAVGTFVGSIFRNLFFLYIGYAGLSTTEAFTQGLDTADTIMKSLFILALIGVYLFMYRRRETKGILPDKNIEAKPTLESLLRYENVPELPKREIEGKPTLYVFRHGESDDNKELIFSGWRDPELTDKGREQAKILAQKLKDKTIDKLISSPQKRAVETMKIAMSLNKTAKNLPVEIDERIKERSYGKLQGQSKMEWYKKDPEYIQRVRRSYDGVPDGGESIAMVYDRTKAFADELVKLMRKEKINVAVSCHGNTIRCFRKYFEGLSDKETATIETPLAQDYAAYTIE